MHAEAFVIQFAYQKEQKNRTKTLSIKIIHARVQKMSVYRPLNASNKKKGFRWGLTEYYHQVTEQIIPV